MSQSLSKLYIHLIFHIKNHEIYILEKDKKELYAYIGSIIKDRQSIPILINGTKDHLHILMVLSKNIALATLTEDIKKHSSRWIKTRGIHYSQFAWQGGYSGFSVSKSLHDRTKHYIQNQEEHHKKMSFQEELITFLKEYHIEYDERYLWTN